MIRQAAGRQYLGHSLSLQKRQGFAADSSCSTSICCKRFGRRRQSRLIVSSGSQQKQGRQDTAYSPQGAPNYRASSSPPPPPPPPPPPRRKQRFRPNGWGVFAFLLAGAALWWSYLDSQMPEIYRDADNGLQYVTTKGGNKVVIGEDPEGRVYFVDAAGNFYYDTGNSRMGFYVVTPDSQVFNVFEDGEGERQTVFVGSFDDLKTQKIKRLGGIPVEMLQRAFGRSFDGTITGFIAPTEKEDQVKIVDGDDANAPPAVEGFELEE